MRQFFLILLFYGILLFPAAGHDADAHAANLNPGDVGYQHEKYHEPYKRLVIEVNGDAIGPGDEKYQQEKYGETYKQLYASQKCACKSGYCRPTLVRSSKLGAETGFDVMISGKWVPVPRESLHHENSLSKELWAALMGESDAHVCAYPDATAPFGQIIECVIVPEPTG